ncbi:MAG: HAMP domain-containing histidine kinase [Bacteroidia bacterium]
MKLRALILLIVVYILAAFGWLTYSLLNYSNSDYTLKNDVLKAGLNACILQIIQESKNGNLGSDSTKSYFIKQLNLDVNPEKLSSFVKDRYNNNFVVDYIPLKDRIVIQLQINQERLDQLETQYDRQKKMWWFQSILLFMLVGTGVFGVFYSINSLFKLNKQQNNFLLSVTHEFKTPIAAIRLMLQTILNPKIKEEKKRELIEKSIDNTHRLEDLTENMLTATQIEYGQYVYNMMSFDLSELMHRIISSHEVKGRINTEIQDKVIYTGDKIILRIAISNLINNAFKYSNEGEIDVILKKSNNAISIEVKDQGIGVSSGERKKIFNKFYRVQDEETRTTKGTGLGLFIVKRAVKNHGGTIEVSDNHPVGAIFSITLPI